MKCIELIGKRAIRTKPIIEKVMGTSGLMLNNTLVNKENYAYTTEPIKVINATENHIVAERKCITGDIRTIVLNCQYCDDNWINYDELIKPIIQDDDFDEFERDEEGNIL